jgi:protein-S-isoprenylcysteine O-methyltransferase Ste14
MYDIMMRFPLLIWALFCVTLKSRDLVPYMNKHPLDFVYLADILSRVSATIFLLLIAVVVIARTRPSAKASGIKPRIAALAGTFLTYAIALFPRRELSVSMEMTSTVLILIGTLGAVVALAQLGRSFSIMAETRKLVTSGPYRFVRHPLYLTEEIAMLGIFLQFASVWAALILALQIIFQLRRMDNEEAVLTSQFLEYATYSQSTARLIPGIY